MFKRTKNDFIKGKFYRATERGLKGIADFFQFTNTINASKDIGFKWLCTTEKFNGVKNEKHGRFSKNAIPVLEKLCQMFITL